MEWDEEKEKIDLKKREGGEAEIENINKERELKWAKEWTGWDKSNARQMKTEEVDNVKIVVDY